MGALLEQMQFWNIHGLENTFERIAHYYNEHRVSFLNYIGAPPSEDINDTKLKSINFHT